jgi:hypothetical protein
MIHRFLSSFASRVLLFCGLSPVLEFAYFCFSSCCLSRSASSSAFFLAASFSIDIAALVSSTRPF